MARTSPQSVFTWISRGLGGIVNMLVAEFEEGTPVDETSLEHLKGEAWRLTQMISKLDPNWIGDYSPILTDRKAEPDGEKRAEAIKES